LFCICADTARVNRERESDSEWMLRWLPRAQIDSVLCFLIVRLSTATITICLLSPTAKYLVTQTTDLRTDEHSVTVNHQTQTNHAHHHAHHRFNNETEKRNSNGLLASSGQLNCTATGGGTGPTYRSTSS